MNAMRLLPSRFRPNMVSQSVRASSIFRCMLPSIFCLCLGSTRVFGIAMCIENVPAYSWYHGCGPTAAASVLGYWDLHGMDNLFDASGWADVSLTMNVQEQISSAAHNAKYDPSPDNPNLPIPPDTSIADFFRTSEDGLGYGWSYLSYAVTAFEGYGAYRGYEINAWNVSCGSQFGWSDLVTEIDNGRPMMFLVDTDGNNSTDHFIPVLGYDRSRCRRPLLWLLHHVVRGRIHLLVSFPELRTVGREVCDLHPPPRSRAGRICPGRHVHPGSVHGRVARPDYSSPALAACRNCIRPPIPLPGGDDAAHFIDFVELEMLRKPAIGGCSRELQCRSQHHHRRERISQSICAALLGGDDHLEGDEVLVLDCRRDRPFG